ncbi:MAG TPA: hypothetical protein VN880_09995 [Solirubrobacteraceae bacterium]|jgi:hypothetical protein|nr:hypothetical protein [Solirubrobacteraceae bacterium]
MSIGPDIGGDIADAPSHGELIHDIVSLDIVLDFLEVREFGDIPVGDLPFDKFVDTVVTNEAVRETVAKRVAEAQAKGRAFPLPSAREIANSRERALKRLQK